jgi:hypothetical protein
MAGKYRRQASALSLVRYGPELSALTALLRQAQQTRNESIASARTGAASIQSAVDLARPDVRRVYTGAQKIANAQNAITAPNLASLPAGNPFTAAASIEQSGLQGRLAESRASTLSELDQRRVGAAAGYASERRQANRELRKTGQQVGQRYQDLARERGAFEASTITDLRGAAAKTRADTQELVARLTQQERNSLRSAGTDPDTLKPIPFGPQDPKAPKNQPKVPKTSKPTEGDRTAAARYSHAQSQIQRIDNPKFQKQVPDPVARRHAIAELLVNGNREQGIPALPQAIVAAALDMHFMPGGGYLHPNTIRRLHDQGYKVRTLPGITTYNEWRRRHPGVPFPGRAPTAPFHGQQRPT